VDRFDGNYATSQTIEILLSRRYILPFRFPLINSRFVQESITYINKSKIPIPNILHYFLLKISKMEIPRTELESENFITLLQAPYLSQKSMELIKVVIFSGLTNPKSMGFLGRHEFHL
jgi:hypothetical protein